jgi:hypothetical protein
VRGQPRQAIRSIDLKSDMPSVNEAVQRLEQEIASARREKSLLLKVIHGYGSSGVGGDIRIGVQRHLRELCDAGKIRSCIFGENWGTSDEATWKLVKDRPEVKSDPDLGRRNLGITVVVL